MGWLNWLGIGSIGKRIIRNSESFDFFLFGFWLFFNWAWLLWLDWNLWSDRVVLVISNGCGFLLRLSLRARSNGLGLGLLLDWSLGRHCWFVSDLSWSLLDSRLDGWGRSGLSEVVNDSLDEVD